MTEYLAAGIMEDVAGSDIVFDIHASNIYLTEINDGVAHYHIFIGDKSYWGKGVAKLASLQIIEYGFRTLNLNQIILRVKSMNLSACNLYKALGFNEVQSDGEWITMSKTVSSSAPRC